MVFPHKYSLRDYCLCRIDITVEELFLEYLGRISHIVDNINRESSRSIRLPSASLVKVPRTSFKKSL